MFFPTFVLGTINTVLSPVVKGCNPVSYTHLAGEANNINQLAHRANAGGFALGAVELVKLKNRIVEIINQLSDDWKMCIRDRLYSA